MEKEELSNLFKQEPETTEQKIKEVLNLEHGINIEKHNEIYEFPPIL